MSYPQRKSLLSRQGGRCYYCRHNFRLWQITLDHKQPKSKGGGRGDNLVAACFGCNSAKGDMTEAEFLASDYLMRKMAFQTRLAQRHLAARVKRLLFQLRTAEECVGCCAFDITVSQAPVMTAYAAGPQPQPLLCPQCSERWIEQWRDRWSEWRQAQGGG